MSNPFPACPSCGLQMNYLGADDGLGEFGDSVCDEYECDCGQTLELNCVDAEEYDEEYEDDAE